MEGLSDTYAGFLSQSHLQFNGEAAALLRLWHCDNMKAYDVANMLAWLLSGSNYDLVSSSRNTVWTNLAGIVVF